MEPKAFLPIASSLLLLGCAALDGKTATPPNPPVDWGEVAFYAQVANAVYRGADETAYLPRLAGDWDIATGTTPTTDVRYYVMTHKSDRRQLIAIRGTSSRIDIVEDAEYIKREDGALGIYVHEGFDRCTREIHAAVRPHLDTSRRIEITGHSLGGAVALLLGMELDHSRQFKVARIMTFGQPKVTNEEGVQRFRHSSPDALRRRTRRRSARPGGHAPLGVPRALPPSRRGGPAARRNALQLSQRTRGRGDRRDELLAAPERGPPEGPPHGQVPRTDHLQAGHVELRPYEDRKKNEDRILAKR